MMNTPQRAPRQAGGDVEHAAKHIAVDAGSPGLVWWSPSTARAIGFGLQHMVTTEGLAELGLPSSPGLVPPPPSGMPPLFVAPDAATTTTAAAATAVAPEELRMNLAQYKAYVVKTGSLPQLTASGAPAGQVHVPPTTTFYMYLLPQPDMLHVMQHSHMMHGKETNGSTSRPSTVVLPGSDFLASTSLKHIVEGMLTRRTLVLPTGYALSDWE